MLENKKVEASNDASGNIEVFNETVLSEPKNEVTPQAKNKNTLWAKILVVILIFGVLFLGLYKLAIYLEQPKVLFYSVIDTTISDLQTMYSSIKSDGLFKALNDSSLEFSTETDLKFTGLPSQYKDYENFFSSLALVSNIKIDKDEFYRENDFKIKKEDQEKLNLNFIRTDYKNYLKSQELYDNSIELNDSAGLELFDVDKTIALIDIIKKEVEKRLADDRFVTIEEAIAIKGQTIDCKKSSYTFTGKEMKELIDDVIESIKSNRNTFDYVLNLLGIDEDDLETRILEFKAKLNLSETSEFEFSAYTKTTTDEPIRLEIDFSYLKDSGYKASQISYTKDVDYISIEVKIGNDEEGIEFSGKLDSKFQIRLNTFEQTGILDVEREKNKAKIDLDFSNKNDKSAVLKGTIDLDIEEESSSTYQIKFDGELNVYSEKEKTSVDINGKTLLNSGVSVKKTRVNNAIREYELGEEKETILNKFRTIFGVPTVDNPIIDPMNPDIPSPIEQNPVEPIPQIQDNLNP